METGKINSTSLPANWSMTQLAQWTEGQLMGEESVLAFGISTDSRTTRPGDVYIAIKGERFDGHDFVEQAVAKGACAVLVSQKQSVNVPQILVTDTRRALANMAQGHRLAQTQLQALVAVTGSNGKTTVKTLLAHILNQVAPTLATEGNLNNDLGVPITLLQIRDVHRYAVIEMGANHIGEIDQLTRMARPDRALITLAAPAHLEGFGSLQGIIQAKGEIFNGLDKSGIGFFNQDSPGADYWQQRLSDRDYRTFGTQPGVDVQVLDVVQQDQAIQFDLKFDNTVHQVNMPIMGAHNAMNAAAAVAVCLSLGLTWPHILAGLNSFSGVKGRLQTYRLEKGVLIDDSYNANPSSVRAAIDTLASLPGKRVLCLGQMAELGEVSLQAHLEIGQYAKSKQLDYLLSFGEATQQTLNGFNAFNALTPLSHEHMAEQVQKLIEQNDQINILVKGSRSAQMERVVERLLQRNQHARLS